MKERGITAATIAKATGLQQANFTQWKQRLQKPSAEKLSIIADYFDVTVDSLLGRTAHVPPGNSSETVVHGNLHGSAVVGSNSFAMITPSQLDDAVFLTPNEREILDLIRKLSVIEQSKIILQLSELTQQN
jgi:transcriptional regulator with XRE-family HTH domain